MTLATVQDPIVISQYEVLLGDIAEAKSAAVTEFEYETKEGDKLARSYLFQLRKLRARIESARKDAKSYALAYGKRVDEQAKELSSQVDELIQPHQEQLEAIARKEAARVAAHEAVLHAAVTIGEVRFGETSTVIQARIAGLDGISLDGLEEFADRVAAAIVTARQALQQALQQALAAEYALEELARFKAAQEQREAEERQAQIKREAQERADAEAAAAAADAIAAAEKRAAAAEAALAAAAAPAPAPVAAPVVFEPPCAVPVAKAAPAPLPLVQVEMRHPARELFIEQLLEAIDGMGRKEVCNAIADGELHDAVCVNWGLFE